MKKILLLLPLIFFAGWIQGQDLTQTVNARIGDESYIRTFQSAPDEYTHEQLRVQTHLLYVEARLRAEMPEGLSGQQRTNRFKALDLLHAYAIAGRFPSNRDYPNERRPCFIDDDGNICAVGYLIQETVGREVAEQINKTHKYDLLLDMNEAVINEWAEANGFTLEECATIQPAYGWIPSPDPIQQPVPRAYGISSGFVGGMNLAVNTVNLSGRFGHQKGIARIGILTGAAQVVMGLTHFKKDHTMSGLNGTYTYSYKAQNNLSYINIAAGTTTMLTSAFNLFLSQKIRDKKNALGLYAPVSLNNTLSMGVSFSRSF